MSEAHRDAVTARSGWRMHSLGGVIRIHLCLLPLAALVTAYLLLVDRFTAVSPASLARASYGWPFDWVTQDLSRYAAASFPTSIGFNWTRAWDEPIVTEVDWLSFAGNVLIVGVGTTAAFFALVFVIRCIAAASRPS